MRRNQYNVLDSDDMHQQCGQVDAEYDVTAFKNCDSACEIQIHEKTLECHEISMPQERYSP